MQRDQSGASPDGIVYQPNNIEAEQAILGAILVNNRAYWECAELLGPQDFFEPVHANIYEACQSRIKAGHLADAVTLKVLFDTDPALADLNGWAYLQRLAEAATSIVTAKEYARVIVRLSRRREVMRQASAAAEIIAEARYDGDPEPLRRARAAIDAMLAGDVDDVADVQTLADRILEDSKSESAVPISTGYGPLDDAMGGGYVRGRLYVFRGKSKHFKTGVMLSTAAKIALRGVPVGWIAAELSRELVGQRLLASVGQFDPETFKRLSADGAQQVVNAALSLGPSVFIVGAQNITFGEFQAKCERLVHEKKCKVIFVDYWQRIRGEPVGARESYLAEIADWMLAFAERENVVMVTGSQINARTGLTYYGDGLQRAASWQYTVHKGDTPQLDATVPGGKLDPLWMTGDVDRHGTVRSIGSTENPFGFIHPYGPRLVLADNHHTLV